MRYDVWSDAEITEFLKKLEERTGDNGYIRIDSFARLAYAIRRLRNTCDAQVRDLADERRQGWTEREKLRQQVSELKQTYETYWTALLDANEKINKQIKYQRAVIDSWQRVIVRNKLWRELNICKNEEA